MKGKKFYEPPATAVTRVELESSICGGSVQFGEDDSQSKGVDISAQGVADTSNNDFSANPWQIDN